MSASASALDFPIPAGYGWQYHLIVWIQSFSTPTLDQAAKLLSVVGLEGFYFAAFAIILWSINRTIGLRLGYLLLCSMFVNGWMKELFHVIRPIGIPGIQSKYMSSAIGYSMPSAHAQGTMTFWLGVACWLRRKWLWVVAFVIPIGVALSRVYLGLHWPMDALVGLGLGLVFGIFGWGIGRWWTYRQYAFHVRITIAVVLPILLLIIHLGAIDGEYAAFLLGFGVGAVVDERWLRSEIDPAWWKRICCLVIGVAGLVLLLLVIPWPKANLLWLIIRDTLVGLWGALGAPYVFHRCGLYRSREAD